MGPHTLLSAALPKARPLEEALSALGLSLLEALKAQRAAPLAREALAELWPAAISMSVRALTLRALLSKEEARRLDWGALCSQRLTRLQLQRLSLAAERRSRLSSWLITWEREACAALTSHGLATSPLTAWLSALYQAQLPSELPLLLQRLGEAYERVIGLSPTLTEGAMGALCLSEGGLRQARASYYTPEWLIEHILNETLRPVAQRSSATSLKPVTLLDPSCGVGRFLAQGALYQAELIGPEAELSSLISRSVFGVDLDPHAVELCRGWLWALGALNEEESAALREHVRCGDALLGLPPHEGTQREPLAHWRLSFPERVSEGRAQFDVIVGNPPYIDSERMKRLYPAERALLTRRFESCKGNWDLFIPFVELSSRLLSPRGAQAMVTPKLLISADYASALQGLLLQQPITQLLDYRRCEVFQDADVEVVVLVAQGAALHRDLPSDQVEVKRVSTHPPYQLSALARFPQPLLNELPRGHWGFVLGDDPQLFELLELWRRAERLGALVTISDGATTSEAYLLKELIQEAPSPEQGPAELLAQGLLPLVNTGLIDPFERLWGQRRARYLKSDWGAPALPLEEVERRFPRRAQQALSDKVLVAGLARRIEAVVAPPGVLCGKSARQLIPPPGLCPYALCALLNSQLMHTLYGALFGLRGLSRSWSLGSRQLSALPTPPLRALQAYTGALLSSPDQLSHEGLRDELERAPQQALSLLGRALHRWPRDPALLDALNQEVLQSFKLEA